MVGNSFDLSGFRYHLAEKKIQSVDGVIDGIKLEQFIFDSIPYAPSISLFEVVMRLLANFLEFKSLCNYCFSPCPIPAYSGGCLTGFLYQSCCSLGR